jgi:hypothetical protein
VTGWWNEATGEFEFWLRCGSKENLSETAAAERALVEMAKLKETPGKIVVDGPSNVLMTNGKGEDRGFKPERTVVQKEDRVNGVHKWVIHYHITEPKRISMVKRWALVDRTVGLVRQVQGSISDK